MSFGVFIVWYCGEKYDMKLVIMIFTKGELHSFLFGVRLAVEWLSVSVTPHSCVQITDKKQCKGGRLHFASWVKGIVCHRSEILAVK